MLSLSEQQASFSQAELLPLQLVILELFLHPLSYIAGIIFYATLSLCELMVYELLNSSYEIIDDVPVPGEKVQVLKVLTVANQ
jgi:hypothetical protein